MSKFSITYNQILLVFIASIITFPLIIGTSYAQEFAVESIYEPGLQAMTAFATEVAEATPKIIAAIILLIIGLVAGKVVGKVVAKTASTILLKANLRQDQDIISQSTNQKDTSKLMSATIRWFVYLFFIIAAINALEFEQLSSALTDLWLWVPNLLAFILIVIVGLIVTNFVGKWLDQELIKKDLGSSKYVSIGIKVVLYSIIFAIALTQLGIGKDIIPILVSAFSWSIAVGIGAAIAVGLGFALKDIIPAAITSASKKHSILKVGQKVKIGDQVGIITAVDLLHIILANEKNESMVIPTKDLSTTPITIYGIQK